MAQSTDRLQRLITDKLGECCDADVERRLDELDALDQAATTDHITDDLRTLSTLGNETRYRIARLCATADERLCVCELTPLLDVSESAISHALSDLTDAGLLSREQQGKWRYYESTDRAERLFDALDATGDSKDE
jgi:DNA-binding transcriptional ArsR family regulator